MVILQWLLLILDSLLHKIFSDKMAKLIIKSLFQRIWLCLLLNLLVFWELKLAWRREFATIGNLIVNSMILISWLLMILIFDIPTTQKEFEELFFKVSVVTSYLLGRIIKNCYELNCIITQQPNLTDEALERLKKIKFYLKRIF